MDSAVRPTIEIRGQFAPVQTVTWSPSQLDKVSKDGIT